MAVLLLPLVYMIVASLIGLIGTATWSDDVRAGLAGSLISAVIGGLPGRAAASPTNAPCTRCGMPAPGGR